MTESLIERICNHEGFRSTPYLDTTGHWTIGFGCKITDDQAQNTYVNGISQQEALDMLEQRLGFIKNECNKAFPWLLGLDEVRCSVIYEMAYQMGVEGVAQFKMMIADIRAGDWENAAEDMERSNWHTQTPARCDELAEIMRTGVLP